jgi:CRP/FNR family transcriptional regulator, cyclic AMP receptor protein
MAMISNLDLILRVPLFAHLTAQQAEPLANAVTKKRYKRGECMVEQGAHSDVLLIILTGRARVLMTDKKGREVILAILRSGDYMGDMCLIDQEPNSASVHAEVLTDVLVLGRDEFLRALSENASIALGVMRVLTKRLRYADHKISSLALTGVYARVASLLLETAVADGRGVLTIRDRVSRQDVAKMVGASREMVSRVMKDFEEKGFLQTLEGGSMMVNERRQSPR